jgi:hypothetical protein
MSSTDRRARSVAQYLHTVRVSFCRGDVAGGMSADRPLYRHDISHHCVESP